MLLMTPHKMPWPNPFNATFPSLPFLSLSLPSLPFPYRILPTLTEKTKPQDVRHHVQKTKHNNRGRGRNRVLSCSVCPLSGQRKYMYLPDSSHADTKEPRTPRTPIMCRMCVRMCVRVCVDLMVYLKKEEKASQEN